MKFKIKVLVASLAFLSALPASAEIVNSVSGNSNVILTLIDRTQNVSATFDLGIFKSTFVSTNTNAVQAYANQNQSFNVSGIYGDAWTGFWNTSGVTAANVEYAIFSGDTTGSATGNKSIFAAVATPSSFTGMRNEQVASVLSFFDTAVDGLNGESSHFDATDGANFTLASQSGDAAHTGNLFDPFGRINFVPGDYTQAIGTSMTTMNISNSSNNPVGIATLTNYDSYFNLTTAGMLNYTAVAAVPEADTSLMLLAGIGMMGFIARRRKS